MSKETMFVSFSGGRTSAYMARWLLDNKSDEYDFIFTFANTGLEHEKTLEFIDKCDKAWGLNLVWLEAVVNHGERVGTTHKIVTFETASRNGEPFEEVIKKYGISNTDFPHCNRELKLNVIYSYKRSIGFKSKHLHAVGIRSDELDRINLERAEKERIAYPLAFWHPTTKAQVIHWWSHQDFDLEIPEHLGNCVTCWKKSDRKLMTIAVEEPERFDFMRRMEKAHAHTGANAEERPRVFFRKHKTVDDIFEMASKPFKKFVDHKPELQLGLLDDLDLSGGCSESCDIYAD
tara:strand:- start:2751 stop:3620 length:870 start_codon:yes stop_codon:yes gene_type:complete